MPENTDILKEKHRKELDGLGYELLESLNGKGNQSGAYGIVYKVKKISYGNQFHVAKTLHEEHTKKDIVVKSFREEAYMLMSLKPSPEEIDDSEVSETLKGFKNIALADSFFPGNEKRSEFFFIEYVEGMTFSDLMTNEEGNYLSAYQVVEMGIQFCQGMIYCQYKRPDFIHRDIKPQNIMISKNNSVKLIDFGLSSSIGYKTGLEVAIGTPAYLPPEQWDFKTPSTMKSDIYSFGISLRQLLTGIRPDLDESENNMRNRMVPEELINVIKTCMESNPKNRFNDFKTIKEQLLLIQHKLDKNKIKYHQKNQCTKCGYVSNNESKKCALCGSKLSFVSPAEIPVKIDKEKLEFGDVELGKLKRLNFEIENVITNNVVISFSIENNNFKIVNDVSNNLLVKANGKQTVNVEFKPTNTSKNNSDMVIQWLEITNPDETLTYTNDKSGKSNKKIIKLIGAGIESEKNDIEYHVIPGEIDFGNVEVGSENRKGITIRNSGKVDLHIEKVEFHADTDVSNIFSCIQKIFPLLIKPGGNQILEIKFKPGDNIQYKSNVEVHIKGVKSVKEISIEGKGIEITKTDEKYTLIEKGSFIKGCTPSKADELVRNFKLDSYSRETLLRNKDEKVNINYDFKIAKYPVTNKEYWEFCKKYHHPMPSHWLVNLNPPYAVGLDYNPVTNIDYYDAIKYCEANNLRLPGDNEWEKAARGKDGWCYPWGNNYDRSKCNSAEAMLMNTVPADYYPEGKSFYNTFQQTGNIWEITEPDFDSRITIRGGTYLDACKFAGFVFDKTLHAPVNYKKENVGFRVVMPAKRTDTKTEITIKGHTMVLVPKGPFLRGIPNNQINGLRQLIKDFGFNVEQYLKIHIERLVDIPAFYISKYVVTNEEYLNFIQGTNYIKPIHWIGGKDNYFPSSIRDFPVVNVSFQDIMKFCEWIGNRIRLPYGDEWEKAARGTDGRLYPWGNTFNSTCCNCWEYAMDKLMSARSFENGQSPYGVYNMAGNIGEYTIEKKHMRGGSYKNYCDLYGLTFYYLEMDPDYKAIDVGFRCVKEN